MSNAIFFQTTTVQSRIGACTWRAGIVSSYFFSVGPLLYFYVIFVLPIIVK